ncbi:HtaA domain-containing protein [Streptomyces sp. NPDC127084]|uniref:HtaA domain-containing protein n=1 Tax=Streptomyces sp. NPDC127084 TaxID=3347133 RepID=UPI00364B8CF0
MSYSPFTPPCAHPPHAAFGGKVRFACAAHGIDWTIGDIKVKTTGKSSGTLIADVATAKGTSNDVAFAKLDLGKADFRAKKGVVTLKNLPAKLTDAGAAQFAGPNGESFYQPGTPIDPVTVTLTLDKDAALPITDPSGGAAPTADASSSTDGGASGGTVGGGTAGGGLTTTGSLATTGSEVPGGALLTAAGALAAAGAGVVFAVRRRAETRN